MSSAQIFAKLFSLVPGRGAPTAAPPSQRLPILTEALESGVARRQRLALRACDEALKTGPFSRDIDSEPYGLRVSVSPWTPKTYGEIFDAYRQIWTLVREQVDQLTGDERDTAVNVLLRRAREVAGIHALSDLVLETLQDLSRRSFVDRRKVVERVEEIVRYQGRTLPTELLYRWRALRDELVGGSFSSQLQRYVGLALRGDEFDDEGNRLDRAKPVLERLAFQVVEQPELLDAELNWLLSGDAPGGLKFGYELAKRDPSLSLVPRILGRLRSLAPKGNGYLLSGYLRAVAEADVEVWEAQLDSLANDEQLRVLVPELTWRGQLTDRAARRILNLAEVGAFPVEHFAMFGMGGVGRSLSEDILFDWLDFLMKHGSQTAAASALQIFFYFYVFDHDGVAPPEQFTWRLLTHEAFFKDEKGTRLDSESAAMWRDTAVRFLDCYPNRALTLVDFVLERMGEKGGIDDGLSSPVVGILNRALDIDAAGVWRLIAPLLGPPIDVRAYRLGEWLHGEVLPGYRREGALTRMPEDEVWAWVEADVEKRAWFIASLAPGGLFRDPRKTCWAREVLTRYGDRDDVRRNIGVNFGVEVWWGPESEHWKEKKAALLEYRLSEDHPRVLSWIDDYVEYLDEQIERAKTEEERDW